MAELPVVFELQAMFCTTLIATALAGTKANLAVGAVVAAVWILRGVIINVLSGERGNRRRL